MQTKRRVAQNLSAFPVKEDTLSSTASSMTSGATGTSAPGVGGGTSSRDTPSADTVPARCTTSSRPETPLAQISPADTAGRNTGPGNPVPGKSAPRHDTAFGVAFARELAASGRAGTPESRPGEAEWVFWR